MKLPIALIFLPAMLIPCLTLGGNNDRAPQQAQLDAECEAARERKLAPERERYSLVIEHPYITICLNA